MPVYTIANEKITVSVNGMGAELSSLRGKSGTEYLWDAKPTWWKRSSPVLFPFVGGLKNGCYQVDGKTYPMAQHGFARDMEFSLIEKEDSMLRFRLCSNAETLERYPFPFRLDISYQLEGNSLTVGWDVANTGEKTMYFSIGAHPAFLCPPPNAPFLDGKSKNRTDCFIQTDAEKEISYRMLEGGLICPPKYQISLENGRFPITSDTFEHDALVIEGNQAHKVSLNCQDGLPFVTVSFDAPLFGLWSPPGGAPFVCIEPWYGRCDAQDFNGSLKERDYTNCLEPGQIFHAQYSIQLEQE